MFMRNEFEVFPEEIRVEEACVALELAVRVEDVCDSFGLVEAPLLIINPVSVPPNIKTIEPTLNNTTITTTATDLFKAIATISGRQEALCAVCAAIIFDFDS
jgi:hypothetical protein